MQVLEAFNGSLCNYAPRGVSGDAMAATQLQVQLSTHDVQPGLFRINPPGLSTHDPGSIQMHVSTALEPRSEYCRL